jgi:hypothetical protein
MNADQIRALAQGFHQNKPATQPMCVACAMKLGEVLKKRTERIVFMADTFDIPFLSTTKDLTYGQVAALMSLTREELESAVSQWRSQRDLQRN